MRRTHYFSLMIATAYLALAVLSLFMELPNRLVNNVSLGALLFSISELLEVWNNRKIKRRSVIDIIKDENCKDKYSVALCYIQEILKEKNSYLNNMNSKVKIVSFFFKSLAFMCLIVYPHVSLLDAVDSTNHFGVLCTILSLTIVFFSFHFEDMDNYNRELVDVQELLDCYTYIIDETNEINDRLLKQNEDIIKQSKQLVGIKQPPDKQSKRKNAKR